MDNSFKNKALVVLIIIGSVAFTAGLVWLTYFVILPLFNRKPIDDNKPEIILSISTKEIAGIWNKSETIGANWADRYHFWESGRYAFYPNPLKNPKDRIIGYFGYWKVDNGKLILNPAREIFWSGGNYSEQALAYIGAVEEQKDTNAPMVEIQLGNCKNMQTGKYKCMVFGQENFFKFSDNASTYLDFKIENEPELKLARNISENLAGDYSYAETFSGQTWNYNLKIYLEGADFKGNLKISGAKTNINTNVKIIGLPDGSLNVIFDSYNQESGKMLTKCIKNVCGREIKNGDIIFSLSNLRILWIEYYPFTDASRNSNNQYFRKN